METKNILTWSDVDSYIQKLCLLFDQEVAKAITGKLQEFPIIIYGLPRGGQLTALLLAYAASGRFIVLENAHDAMQMSHYHGQQVVIVDDIMDSGKSLESFAYAGCQTAVLVQRSSCPLQADYIGRFVAHEEYVLFPWEKTPTEDRLIWLKRKEREKNLKEQTRLIQD